MKAALGLALGLLCGAGAARAQDAGAPEMTRVEDGHTGVTVEIPTAWLEDEVPADANPGEIASPNPEPAAVDLSDPELATARPSRWVSPAPRRCRRYRRRRFCDGPLRVPEPNAAQAERARRLGLGGVAVARHLLLGGPRPEWVAAAPGQTRSTLLFPVDGGHLWRGLRRARRRRPRHKGTDIGAPRHTPVRAVNDALVVYAGNELRGYGNLLMLVHADASVTFYAHLFAAWVPAGARVRRGQVIGEVGDTGLARGTHLHFEWRVGGHPRDPARHFRRIERAPAEEAAEARPTPSSVDGESPPEREPSFTDRPEAGDEVSR
ncbi:MAG: M23 family metallopeptidase [Deltaproteobacteria bacterium]|nr:M23 family metallopeptidase [Deltaproteobacteria bacterium]